MDFEDGWKGDIVVGQDGWRGDGRVIDCFDLDEVWVVLKMWQFFFRRLLPFSKLDGSSSRSLKDQGTELMVDFLNLFYRGMEV